MSYETLKHYCSIVAAVYQNVTFLSWACPSPQCCGTCCKEMTLPPTEGPSGRKSTAVCCLFSMQYLSKIRKHKVCFVSRYFKSFALHNFLLFFLLVAVIVVIVIIVWFLFIVVLQALTVILCIVCYNGDIFIYKAIFLDGIMHIYENIKHQ